MIEHCRRDMSKSKQVVGHHTRLSIDYSLDMWEETLNLEHSGVIHICLLLGAQGVLSECTQGLL